jgi:transposase
MYSQIQSMKEAGFSIRQVSRVVRVSRNTISKYWEMTPEEYAQRYKTINRMTALEAYEPVVLKWLEAFPCMTAAQVRDWLEERYQLDAAERSVRRFVAKLREQHGIARKDEPKREYEAVEELPKGYQVQLDFGEDSVRYSYICRYIKLYFVVFTLSYSRYKWGILQERPFLSTDLVQALYGCFEYFGGMPKQFVYDQDSIIVVSENYGDIIHTQAFAAFLAETKLDVRVCRKSDPETKGLIESSVKFIKGNFMKNRYFMDIDIWNQSFEDWLIRTGNDKKHGTTKRKPAEMFAEEQEHLLPLFGVAPAAMAEDMERRVRKDNTILYLSNRYSLPLGTYRG